MLAMLVNILNYFPLFVHFHIDFYKQFFNRDIDHLDELILSVGRRYEEKINGKTR